MTKKFPIIIPDRDLQEQKKEKIYGIKARSIKQCCKQWAVEVFIMLLAMYLCVAAMHGVQYKPGEYVCHHMARDLEDTLESFGFDVQIVVGWSDESIRGKRAEGSSGHAWIKINGVEFDSVWLVPYILGNEYPYDRKIYNDYVDYAQNIYPQQELIRLGLAGKL
jgi:hypothetical protein